MRGRRVTLSGKVIGPSKADPRRTWRGKYADLFGPLYVTPNTPRQMRDALASSYVRPVLAWDQLPEDDRTSSWTRRAELGPRLPR